MCNPRRIRVRATRELAEAWDQEVRRQVTLHGQAVAEARIRERLAATFGAPTLAALATVFGRSEGWVADGDSFRHDLAGGRVVFHPSTLELEIVAVAVADVAATAEASRTVRGDLEESVQVEGTGTYYDDRDTPWYRARARRAAEDDAATRLETAVGRARRAAQRRVDSTEGAAVESEATELARRRLDQTSSARAEQLREQAAGRLSAVGVQARALFHQALAEAYRDAIMAFARARRADGLTCTEHDGVIDIEFEYEA